MPMNASSGGQRGAALILEIIIYLVIVALIAVAVTSGVRAIRDLTLASHARGDARTVQAWVEGKYIQDRTYPQALIADTGPIQDQPNLTKVDGSWNIAVVSAVNSGPNSGYCIGIYNPNMSDYAKSRFWISSGQNGKLYQSGTGSNGGSESAPASGISGLTCPF